MEKYSQGEILPQEVIEALKRELGSAAIDIFADDGDTIVRGTE